MVKIVEADEEAIRNLSRMLMKILEDENGEIYQENVAKFGIPKEYVKRAFIEENLLKMRNMGKAKFYLAMEDYCKTIIGFAQTMIIDEDTIELDRIIIFPEFTRKGIGTSLLQYTIKESKQRGFKKVVVNAGKDELHARRFYENNGFKKIEEYTIDAPWGKKLDLVSYQFSL
ncbi:MAG: GNAT family N-acetyltransferase [Candidatus Methanomethyliaceae archaeon]|nr:GNAT family N-acetyltransferase [Candidatus Methanomethyliaceae archaeon]